MHVIQNKYIHMFNKIVLFPLLAPYFRLYSQTTWLIPLLPLSASLASVQFSRSVVSNSLWPHGLQHTRPPRPSPTSRVYSNSCPLSQWCHPTISSSVVPFSCLQSFPASGSFQMSQLSWYFWCIIVFSKERWHKKTYQSWLKKKKTNTLGNYSGER